MKRRRARTLCRCGKPMPFKWGWGYRYAQGCPHGKVFKSYMYTKPGEWWGRWCVYEIDAEWRKKVRRKNRKRAGIRNKMRIKRGRC